MRGRFAASALPLLPATADAAGEAVTRSSNTPDTWAMLPHGARNETLPAIDVIFPIIPSEAIVLLAAVAAGAGELDVVLVALAGTLPTGLGVLLVSEADPGILVAQYTGAALLSALLVSLGLWASSVTRNQITAFIAGVAKVTLAGALADIGLPPAEILRRVPLERLFRVGFNFRSLRRSFVGGIALGPSRDPERAGHPLVDGGDGGGDPGRGGGPAAGVVVQLPVPQRRLEVGQP